MKILKPTPKMVNAMRLIFNASRGTSLLASFRQSTVDGLVKRELIQTVKGIDGSLAVFELTELGYKYLRESGEYSYDQVAEGIKMHHMNRALDKFNTDSPARIKTVDDKFNNVGRRCNIRNNNDTETRCWEIVTPFDFVGNPTGEPLYIVRYVGKDWTAYYQGMTTPYYMTDLSHMTNLY